MKKLLINLVGALSLSMAAVLADAAPVSVEGTLIVIPKENGNGIGEVVYLLDTGVATYQLEFAGTPKSLNSLANKRVRVSGDSNGKVIKVADEATSVQPLK